jgi:hypothetical protein
MFQPPDGCGVNPPVQGVRFMQSPQRTLTIGEGIDLLQAPDVRQ